MSGPEATDWELRDGTLDESLSEESLTGDSLTDESLAQNSKSEWSWRSWVSPVLFGIGLALLVGDALSIGMGLALGLGTAHPVTSPVVEALGLRGLVLVKATVGIVLVTLPGVTDTTRQTIRSATAGVVAIGLLLVLTNAWAIFALA